jgi:hypothetical protein
MASALIGAIAAAGLVANVNSVGVINSTETYVSTNTWCNVNTAISQAGNTYRWTVCGYNTTAGEKIGNFKVNLKGGIGGNVADATLASVSGFRDVGDSTPISASFIITVRPGTYASNVANVAVAAIPLSTRDVGGANANVALVASTGGSSNAILGISFLGGDGYSNVVFTNIVVEQLA